MRDPREIPLMTEALSIWQGLDQRIGRRTGYTRSGILFGASTNRDRAKLDHWVRHVDGMQTGAKIVWGAELEALMPGQQDRPQVRPAHAPGWSCRTTMGGPGDCRGGTRQRCRSDDQIALCVVWISRMVASPECSPNGAVSLRSGCSGGWSLVPPVCRKRGDRPAPTESAEHGDAHLTRRRAGDSPLV